MDTSFSIPNLDVRPLADSASSAPLPGDRRERAQPAPEPGSAQVFLSPAGRAAASAAEPTQEAAAPSFSAPAAPQAGPRTVATVPPSPAAAPADGAAAAAAREPDAASAASRPAVQLYLENAARPDNQPPPSAIRESA